MNIFEGARRVSLILAIFGGIIAIVTIWKDRPYVSLAYEVSHFGVAPAYTKAPCEIGVDATESITRNLDNGQSYWIQLCFRASEATDGRMLVPFTGVDKDRSLMNEPYSSDVIEYTKKYARRLRLSADEVKIAEAAISNQRRSDILSGLGAVIGSLFAFWVFIVIVGWIVRGFAGIPRGMDRKPS